MVCLRLKRINFWLATIDVMRIKDPDVQARVVLYQEECADALAEHFLGSSLRSDEHLDDTVNRDVLNATPNVPVILQTISLCARVWGEFEAQRLWLQHPQMPLTPRMREAGARIIEETPAQRDFDQLWSGDPVS